MYITKFKTAIHFVIVFFVGISSLPAFAAGNVFDTKKVVSKGSQLIKEKKYNEAIVLFDKAARSRPKNSVFQYYLGLSYLYARKMVEAEKALSKAIVASNPGSRMNKQASELIYKYRRIRPYSCRLQYIKPPQLVRYSRKKMPLQIYVSDGKMLPKVFDDGNLNREEFFAVGNWTKQPGFVNRLKTSMLYRREYKRAIIDGVARWRWAAKENILSFGLTKNIAKADIVVFWCNKLREFRGFTYHPRLAKGITYPTIVFISLESFNGRQLSLECNQLTGIMAHELGHAIGLEHSQNREDLMFAKGTDGRFTKADKATIRALYSLPPDVMIPSVSR